MKKIVITTLLLAFTLGIYSQKAPKNMADKKLIGRWFLVYKKDNGKMYFERAKPKKYRWGNYLNLRENGELTIGYTGQCGNDTNIFSESGKWTYNPDSKEFKSTISIHKKGKRFILGFKSKNEMLFE